MDMLQQLCQNQPLNRIKSGGIIDDKEEDRISLLPDYLIIEILSCLPTAKDAIVTGCLSKRWLHLWPCVYNLLFINDVDDYDSGHHNFFSFVEKTIAQCRCSKLNKFQLNTSYDFRFASQVNNAIRYAINCNVQYLDLSLWGSYGDIPIVLDELLFINSYFTHLKLSCNFVNPTGAFSWENLRSLSLSKVNLNEGMIQNIFSGSPVLETLEFEECRGFQRLDITSKSVKNFVFSGGTNLMNEHVGLLDLNAPNILSLTIKGSSLLQMIWLIDVSSLVEANLDYTDYDNWILEDQEEEMLQLLVPRLRHVKDLKLGTMLLEVLYHLEDEGFIIPSNIGHAVDDGPKGD